MICFFCTFVFDISKICIDIKILNTNELPNYAYNQCIGYIIRALQLPRSFQPGHLPWSRREGMMKFTRTPECISNFTPMARDLYHYVKL